MKTTVTSNKETINVIIKEIIKDFNLHQRPSSNVEYFGYHKDDQKLLIQFKSGSSYIFSEVPEQTFVDLTTAESTGKFVGANVVGKFSVNKHAERLVIPA